MTTLARLADVGSRIDASLGDVLLGCGIALVVLVAAHYIAAAIRAHRKETKP